MKKKLLFVAALAAIMLNSMQKVNAQWWSLTGNAGTTPGTNFLGTIDNTALVFKTNNVERGRILPGGGWKFNGTVNALNGYSLNGTPFLNQYGIVYNTFVGNAGNSSLSGQGITGVGYFSLNANTSGYQSTALGGYTLTLNTSGYENTAIGYTALNKNTTGYQNTATGASSLLSNATGIQNTANGAYSLYVTTGNNNTAIGAYSLFNNTTGSNNTALGAFANVATGGLSNATAIGYNARVAVSNALVLGGTGANSVNVGIGTTAPSKRLEVAGDERLTSISGSRYLEFLRTGSAVDQNDWRFDHTGSALFISSSVNDFTVGFCDVASFGNCNDPFKFTVFGNALASGGTWQASDLKLKRNITDFSSAMDIIRQLKPKTYFFKSTDYTLLNLPDHKQYGFVAQDLEKVLPELVQTSREAVHTDAKGERKTEDIKSVNYTELIPILTKAIQEQQQQIDELKETIKSLATVQPLSSANESSAKITPVVANKTSLEQNIPNPFNNSSSISYYIPSVFHTASLIITDLSGKTLKAYSITQSGSGKQIITGNTLTAGMYQYSLIIDGRVVDTKKMVLSK